MPERGAAAVLTTLGSPAPYTRTSGRGWTRDEYTRYRSKKTVVLDLKTGRELMVLGERGEPQSSGLLVSPDGRYLLESDSGWLGLNPNRIAVWDLRAHRRIYADTPGGPASMLGQRETRWTPNSEWLAVTLLSFGPPLKAPARPEAEARRRQRHSVLFMRPDGSQQTELTLWEEPAILDRAKWLADRRQWILQWAWAPGSSSVYTLRGDGTLSRVHIPGGETERIWSGPVPGVALPEGLQWVFNQLSVSPDGRWVEIGARATSAKGTSQPTPSASVAVSADGRRVLAIADRMFSEAVWSLDSGALYLADANGGNLVVSHWRVGDEEAMPVAVPPKLRGSRAEAIPGGRLLLWGGNQAYLVDEQGRFAPLRIPELQRTSREFVGVDSSGRMILRGYERPDLLSAYDFSTHTLTRIYP
jgi:hypothetical protein